SAHRLPESLGRESFGVRTQFTRIESDAFQPADRFNQRGGIRPAKQNSRHSIVDGFERSAGPIGDGRAAARLGLERCQTEILAPRYDHGAAFPVESTELVSRNKAPELDVGPRPLLEQLQIWARPHYHQPAPELIESVDGQVQALVRHQRRYD